MRAIIFCLLGCLLSLTLSATLAKVQLTDNIVMPIIRTPVGFAVPWSFRSLANNTHLQTLLLNMNNQNMWSSAAVIAIQAESSADYGCTATDTYCTQNISSAELTDVGTFVFNTVLQPYFMAGIRFESINQTRWNTFVNDLYLYSYNNTFIMSLGEKADTFEARGFRGGGYNLQTWINEMDAFVKAVNSSTPTGQYYVAGPGVNSYASSWINNMSQFWTYCGANSSLFCIFSLQMNFFENDTDATIANLLSEEYFQARINQVFSEVKQYVAEQYVTISRLKIHYGNGIDGVTNTFAAALWAADFIFNWLQMGGYQVYFDTDLLGVGFQSPFSSTTNWVGSPTMNIWPLYYAVLLHPFMIPPIGATTIMTATKNLYRGPFNIKVYSFRLNQTEFSGAVIINKDLNSTLTGEVQLCYNSNQNATYYYLEADSLLDKTAIRYQGYSFNTTQSGSFESGSIRTYTIAPDSNGCYNIPIKYAQLAMVQIKDSLPFVTDAEFKQPSFVGRAAALAVMLALALLI